MSNLLQNKQNLFREYKGRNIDTSEIFFNENVNNEFYIYFVFGGVLHNDDFTYAACPLVLA